MTPESLVLRFFMRDKENFNKYSAIMQSIVLDKEYSLIYKTIAKYYEAIPEHNYISKDEFINFFLIHYTTYKDKEMILTLVSDIYELDVSDSLIMEVIKNLIEKDTANKIIQVCMPCLTENKYGVLEQVNTILTKHSEIISKQNQISPYYERTIDELLEEFITGEGLAWKLDCLQEDIGVLRPGYLGHIFARPDSGKTSFLLHQLSHMAQQIQPDEEIVWFGNEETIGRIILRLYMVVSNATSEQIVQHKDRIDELVKERCADRIKFIPQCNDLVTIRNHCMEYKPKLIVIDSADKVYTSHFKGGDSTERLKDIYYRYRQLAEEYSIPVITVAQASAEAAGKKWLEMHHMDYSKTGKSAEMDFVIGIGRTLDDEDGIRYLNIPKNKLNGKNGKHSVKFNTKTGRYVDL